LQKKAPCSSCWFHAWLMLQPWRWRWYVPLMSGCFWTTCCYKRNVWTLHSHCHKCLKYNILLCVCIYIYLQFKKIIFVLMCPLWLFEHLEYFKTAVEKCYIS
jgi:hypothetical protein